MTYCFCRSHDRPRLLQSCLSKDNRSRSRAGNGERKPAFVFSGQIKIIPNCVRLSGLGHKTQLPLASVLTFAFLHNCVCTFAHVNAVAYREQFSALRWAGVLLVWWKQAPSAPKTKKDRTKKRICGFSPLVTTARLCMTVAEGTFAMRSSSNLSFHKAAAALFRRQRKLR